MRFRATLWPFGSKDVPAISEIVTPGLRREAAYGTRWDVSLLHRVHDRLDVSGAERDVVGHASDAVGVEVDRGGRRAAQRLGAKRSVFELKERFNIKVLLKYSHGLAGLVLLVDVLPSLAADY